MGGDTAVSTGVQVGLLRAETNPAGYGRKALISDARSCCDRGHRAWFQELNDVVVIKSFHLCLFMSTSFPSVYAKQNKKLTEKPRIK